MQGRYDKNGYWRFGEKSRTFVWSPLPAAEDVALEVLRKARVKRQNSTHIFLCPRLLTTEWLKQLHKVSDCLFEIPPGHLSWPSNMFEPLKFAFCFPFVNSPPWQLRGTPKMFQMGRQMHSVLKERGMDGGDLLREFLLVCQRFPSMPQDVVWRMLFFEKQQEVSHK